MSPREVKGPEPRKVSFAVDAERTVSGLLTMPKGARALYMLAHGAGAGMTHPFMAAVSAMLAERGIATLRYQFPYMERGSRRPDTPAIAEATVRAAVAEGRALAPRLPLFAGGKSFGGRMTSQAEAHGALGVAGLAFLGFPLHPPGAPGDKRGDHLAAVKVPMLFLQGTKDEFAGLDLLKPLIRRLGRKAKLHLVEDGNHSFRVPAKTGRKEADVLAELADTLAAWMDGIIGGG
jgi:predicted alpha/beta-hydrolase family hydrolase